MHYAKPLVQNANLRTWRVSYSEEGEYGRGHVSNSLRLYFL